jgi:hypothetical protein
MNAYDDSLTRLLIQKIGQHIHYDKKKLYQEITDFRIAHPEINECDMGGIIYNAFSFERPSIEEFIVMTEMGARKMRRAEKGEKDETP